MARERYPLMAFTLCLSALACQQLLAQGTVWHTWMASGLAFLSAWTVVAAVSHYWHHNL